MHSVIRNSWHGAEELWKVFWLYNFLLGFLIGVVAMLLEPIIPIWVLMPFTIVWGVWVFVSLWRCAFNAEWQGWGYIVRVLVALSLVSVVIDLANASIH